MDDSDEEVTKISSGNYFCHSHLEKVICALIKHYSFWSYKRF